MKVKTFTAKNLFKDLFPIIFLDVESISNSGPFREERDGRKSFI